MKVDRLACRDPLGRLREHCSLVTEPIPGPCNNEFCFDNELRQSFSQLPPRSLHPARTGIFLKTLNAKRPALPRGSDGQG
jgi:hypothetical protein